MATPARLCQAAITASPATIYTAKSDGRTLVQDYNICNTTAGTLTLTLGIGGTSAANALFYAMPIYGYQSVQLSGNQLINALETLQAVASGSGLTVTISGQERV